MVGPEFPRKCTFSSEHFRLRGHAGNKPDLLAREGLPALLEHVGVAHVEIVENSIRVEPKHFFRVLLVVGHGWIYYVNIYNIRMGLKY